MYLAAAGVGTLGIVDFDVVDETNLQRQIIHGQSDIGRPKARRGQETVLEINPLIEVVLHQERLDSTNVHGDLRQYDLIVDGTDNFATRYMVNDAGVLPRQALRLGLDLPLRRPGVGLLADRARR